jgi:hypothetical protein
MSARNPRTPCPSCGQPHTEATVTCFDCLASIAGLDPREYRSEPRSIPVTVRGDVVAEVDVMVLPSPEKPHENPPGEPQGDEKPRRG